MGLAGFIQRYRVAPTGSGPCSSPLLSSPNTNESALQEGPEPIRDEGS